MTSQKPHTDAGTKKALLIAIRNVKGQDLRPSHHAHDDAQLLRGLLIDYFGYPEANVVLMMDDAKPPSHLWPSRKNILTQITNMVAGASANDCFFFYYSGHVNQMSHTKTDGIDEVIYTHTGHYIINDTLQKRLVMPLPRGSKLFALWDSSHPVHLNLEHHNCSGLSHRWMSLAEPSFLDPPLNSETIPTADRQLLPRGRAEDLPSTLDGVKLIRPHSPTSWLPYMSPDSSPSAHCRSLSPISFYPRSNCMGNCQMVNQEEQQAAHVVSLSAWAGTGDVTDSTVTKLFIESLSQHPRPSLIILLGHIKDRVNQTHEHARRNRNHPALFRRNAVDNIEEYMEPHGPKNYWQNPELYSSYPLDMDRLVDTIF